MRKRAQRGCHLLQGYTLASDRARTRPRLGPSAFSLPKNIAAEDMQELVGGCGGGGSTFEHSDNTFQQERGRVRMDEAQVDNDRGRNHRSRGWDTWEY